MKAQMLISLLLLGSICHADNDTSTKPSPPRAPGLLSLPNGEAIARWRKFDLIWAARSERDVSAEIAPFLADSFSLLRSRAAKSLGKLENPTALPHLQSALKSPLVSEGGGEGDNIDGHLFLKLAIGRIDARQLQGRAKVEKMLSSVGLNFPQFVELLKTRDEVSDNTSTQEIIGAVVDLLYSMGKKGEAIVPLGRQLSLAPSQLFLLQISSQPDAKECDLILNYFSTLHVMRREDEELVYHLVSLGPIANDKILRRLQEMKSNPGKYVGLEKAPGKNGYYFRRMAGNILLIAAGQTRDPRMVPVLSYFSHSQDRFIQSSASRSLDFIKSPYPW